jgi:hypothetical protein
MRAKRVRALRKLVSKDAPEVTTYTEGPKGRKVYFDFKDGKLVPVSYEYTGTIRMNHCQRKSYQALKRNYKSIVRNGISSVI